MSQGMEKHSVVMAGIGGRGVMVAALTLAHAALEKYLHVSWLPSMTTAMRGGPCDASVVISTHPIASPLVWRPQAVVVMEASQVKAVAHRVLPGGIIVTESAGLENGVGRDDVEVIKIPALAMAMDLAGDTQGSNLVLLGAYIERSKLLPPELIEKQLEERFGERKQVLESNLKLFRAGRDFIRSLSRGS